MGSGFTASLTTASLLGDLPGHREALQLSDRGKAAGEAFARDAGLPGILLGEDGRFRTAVSRRYYLDAIGRYCGMDLYHPRPLHFLMARYQELGGPLVLHSSTPIAEAVQRGLERPRELVYEPLVVAEEARPLPPLASVRLVDFEDLLVAASRLTTLRALAMRQILSSVREGLMLLDRELRVAPEYSDSVETLLGASGLAGQPFTEILARCLDPERAEVAGEFAETLFNPRVIESLVEKINPLRRVATSTGRVLAFSFARRRGRQGIEGLLVRIEDVTREEILGQELELERRRAEEQVQLAAALVRSDPEQLTTFLDRVGRAALDLRRATPGCSLPPAPQIASLRRALHGAKGDAGMLGLQPLATALHAVESGLAAESDAAGAAVQAALGRLDQLLDTVTDLLRRFSGLRRAVRPPATPDDQAIASLVASAERFTSQLARDLGKEARLVARVPADLLDRPQRELLGEAVAQFVRNALVHGVEPVDERAQAGKPPTATLQLVARARAGGGVEIVFQDDGRGLDLAGLEARAATIGTRLPRAEDPRTLVFEPGLSTAHTVNEHAGRGVGLDAVRQRVLAAGGSVAVHSEAGRYCAFRILLPARAAGAP